MRKPLNLIAIVLLAFTTNAIAQETNNPIDTLAAFVQKMNTTVTTLSKFKVTGYIQANFQKADSMGIKSFAGGDFGAIQKNRFAVRRGRIKFNYAGTLSNYVLQLEATEKGVAIKDAYVNFTEPWLQAVSVTGGVFNRPFGFEVPYSSSSLESPERARYNQTLFPGEEDLGAMLTFQMPKASPWNFIKIDAGYFAGNGINPEFDNKKDFIGHIGITKATPSENIKYGLGVSYYNGGVYQSSVNYYTTKTGTDGIKTFVLDPSKTAKGAFSKRQYTGFDAQLSLESPVGITTLRGEYIMGVQPGQSGSSASPTSNFTTTSPDTYVRNLSGGYFVFVQSFKRTPLSLIIKYDYYDPNTDVKGDEIGVASTDAGTKKTNATDLKYTTTGFGLLYAVSANVKLTLYYDKVKNETSKNLANFSKDLTDNVITFRMQYKF